MGVENAAEVARACRECGRGEGEGATFGVYISGGRAFRRSRCDDCTRRATRERVRRLRGTPTPDATPPRALPRRRAVPRPVPPLLPTAPGDLPCWNCC